jgi:uncharacterized membrane protein
MKCFLLVAFWIFTFSDSPKIAKTAVSRYYYSDQEDLKANAFKVLTTQCNVCHATKKRQDIFTFGNMDSLASDINKQVFLKKKMPKGRKNKLSEQETLALKNWLSLVLSE